jgi:hypothetical protein
LAGVDTAHVNEKDIYLGEAFYYACQGNYVDAIVRQDIALGRFYGLNKSYLDPLHIQFGNSQFSMGDFELSYRMPQRAANAIKAALGGNADQSVRNETAYRLARIFLQKGEPENALKSVGQITGKVPESIRDDELFLRAQIYMANRKFSDAVKPLQELQDAKSYRGFAAYNLGVVLIKTGQEKQGLDLLEKAGQISGDDEVTVSIRDKANLALGSRLIDGNQPALAKQYLERVRLTGPFSNKALLDLGWADVALGRFDGALVPWSVLAKRNMTDQSVQESMLGVPYAYAKLNLPGKAAMLYGKALERFDKEFTRLDASIKSVSEGKLLKALLHEGLKQDKDWIVKLRSLPETPETYYLLELMASRDFEESIKNYLDLDDLSKRLESWDDHLNSFVSQRQPVTQNDQGYDDQIRQLKNRVHDSRQKVNSLMAGQGHMLETMAINELNQRRKHLQEYQNQARIGLAESYERASKMQAPSSEVK